MKPAKFDYYRATSIEHACELLGAHGDKAKILAGGQSLIAAMNFRLARPEILIDISNIENPNEITDEPGGVRIKATTTQRTAEHNPSVRKRLPVLAAAIEKIAHFQIRNKGTVGGSIVNADPASELPAMSLLLDAELQVKSATGERTIEAEDFFITYMTTSLESDEVLASVLFKEPPKNSGWGIHEVARRDGDFAMVGSTAVMAVDSSNTCTYLRIVLFGVAATPVRARQVEAALLGKVVSVELIEAAANHVSEVVDAESDVHATDEYRGNVARVLAARALNDAAKRATVAN
ncbi:MAG: CO/xanthine dehydrogenase FAD-binding subunit [Gammaproteobacteria bacterium]|jgi:CO/xanthine dehydrogenase FAD-binding subunit